jgi:hypothetical protein
LNSKFWDLFSNFTIEKRRAVLFWSSLKDAQTDTIINNDIQKSVEVVRIKNLK